jgi:hypothetical protein
MKNCLVTAVLLVSVTSSTDAFPSSRSVPLGNTQAGVNAQYEVYYCPPLRAQQVVQCVAGAPHLQTAARDAVALPQQANQREEAILEHADQRYAAASQLCMKLAVDKQATCLAAAKEAIVKAWNKSNRADPATEAELIEPPR